MVIGGIRFKKMGEIDVVVGWFLQTSRRGRRADKDVSIVGGMLAFSPGRRKWRLFALQCFKKMKKKKVFSFFFEIVLVREWSEN